MWMRLHRRMTRAALADPALAAEIRAKLAALRAEREAGEARGPER
jgi:hypothetical protein